MIWEKILALLFPRRCPLCGMIVVPRGKLACPTCHQSRKPIAEPRCLQCGKALDGDETWYCLNCEDREFSYERGFALWDYDAVMKKSIQQFKYHGRQEYAEYFVQQLLAEFEECLRGLELEAVIPVPVHRKRLQERGYNQAELLAEGVAQRLKIPLLTNYLRRTRATTPQKGLGPDARRKNLQAAFQINEASESWKSYWSRVLLVDDIYTTGSTVDACARVLHQAGVGKIYVLCLCIGRDI